MRRRDFIGASAGLTLLPLGNGAWAATGAGGPRRLIVVMLRGAVDGLSIVVPYREAAYYAARPTIAIAKPGTGPTAGLALDGDFALHPGLSALLPLWQAKQLAFVHAAGSPDPSRSHFDAQLFLENGTPGRRATADGWMNRLLAALPGGQTVTLAIAVGPTVPQILKGRMSIANLPLGPAAARQTPMDHPVVAAAFDQLYAGNDRIGRAYREGRTARGELMAGISAEHTPEQMAAERMAADNGAPPADSLAATAARLAALIGRDEKIRLAFLSLGGWDTHVRQGTTAGQLALHLHPLGEGLAALAHGLGASWQDTVVIVMSEFGRTVHENGDGGTDHGHGNAMWLLGGPVRGGRIYGEWPGLAAGALYQGRDLAVTTDYRSVLAAVMARHLRLPDNALAAIFPGFAPQYSGLDRLIA